MRVVGQVRSGAGHARGQGLVGLDHVVLFEDIQRRQRRSTRQRVAGVAVRVQERAQGRVVVVERLVHLVGGQAGGQRQVTTGQGLGQAQEVRADARLFTREHRAGAAKAHGDLVVDQVHVIAVAGLTQQLEVHRVVHAHAASALDQWLDDHGADGGVMLGQGLFHGLEHVARVLFPAHALGAQVAVGAGHLEGVQQQRLVGFGEQRHIAHRHGGNGFAVVAVGQGNEALLAWLADVLPVMEAHLQCHFDARRAIVGIEHPVEPGRGHGHQALGQLDHRLVAEAGQNHMFQLVDLVLDTLVDARVGMAEHVDPPAAHRVQVALAFEVLQPHAFAALDRDQRQLLVVFHLGAGVPQDLEVTLHPLIIEAHGHFSWLCGVVRPRKPKQCRRAGQPPRFNGGECRSIRGGGCAPCQPAKWRWSGGGRGRR